MHTPHTPTEGEHIEMGGAVDPERGALIYKKTTEVESVEPEAGSGYARKKIKKVTSESSWLGKPETDKHGSLEEEEQWHDEEVEQNPLYSSSDYVTDFNNPLYNRRISAAEGAAAVALQEVELQQRAPTGKDGGRAARGRPGSQDTRGQDYVDYLSEQPGLGNADTLF